MSRWWRIAGALALSLAGAWLAAVTVPRIPRDSSLEQMFPRDSDARTRFADFDQAFGTDDTLLVAVHDTAEPPVFRGPLLRYLDRVVAQLEADPAVDSVVSVVNLDDFEVSELFGRLFPSGLHPYLPTDRDAITDADRARYARDPLLAQGLVSDDGRTAACWVLLQPELRSAPDYFQQVARIADSLPLPGPDEAGATLHVTGFPLLHGTTLDLLWRDGLKLLAAALGVVALVAWLGGVSWRLSLAFLLAWPPIVGLIGAWSVTTGRTLHVFSNTLLPLLLITAGAGLVHLGRIWTRDGRGSPRLRPTLLACVLTTGTTAVGFGTLAFSPLEPLAWLGEEVALGSVLALAVQVLMLWLMAPAAGRPARRFGLLEDPRPPRWLTRLWPLGLLAALPWFLLAPERIGVLGDLLEYLPADHPRVLAARQAGEALGAETAFEVVVALDEGSAEAKLHDPEFYVALEGFQRELIAASAGRIAFVLSPITLLSFLNTKMPESDDGGAGAGFQVSPRSAAFAVQFLIGPYLTLFTGANADAETQNPFLLSLKDSMKQLLSTDGRRLRFGCRIPQMSPDAILDLVGGLRADLFPRFQESLGVESIYATGYSVLVSETAVEVRRTQVRSLLFGGGALALLLLLILRSGRLWLVAMATNAATLLCLLNLLWAAGTPMNLYSTVLTASLLAIIVDDTIHLLIVYRRSRVQGGDAVDLALHHVGGSLVLSSLCLAAGFGLFAVSSLPIYRQFAWSAAAGIALALYWDWIQLPRWVRRVRPPATAPGASGVDSPEDA